MRARVCSAGHNIVLHAFPNTEKVRNMMKDTTNKFIVVANDNEVLYEGMKFGDAENAMVERCSKVHARDQIQHGKFRVGQHRLKGGKVQEHAEAEGGK